MEQFFGFEVSKENNFSNMPPHQPNSIPIFDPIIIDAYTSSWIGKEKVINSPQGRAIRAL